MKNSKLVCRALACALVIGLPFAGSLHACEEDTHFLMTYVICKSVGFTHEEALTVAAVDQGMDDSVRVNAHDRGRPQIEEEWRWHALDKNGKMRAAGIIARRDQLFKEAVEESDPHNKLIRLGIFFHYQQDTWAHRHHDKKNHLSRDKFTTFNTPAGTPASIASSAMRSAVMDVSSAGLTTTEHPAASAGPIFQAIMSSGKFQGKTSPTTPTGSRTTMATWSSDAGAT